MNLMNAAVSLADRWEDTSRELRLAALLAYALVWLALWFR